VRHPHVRVYTNDHADALDLSADHPCRDLADAHRLMRDLVREYADRVGAHEAMGDVVEFEGEHALTLWPQDHALTPVHISIHFCEQRHDAGG